MRRVEREGARGHLRHADAALHARQPPREQPVAPLERVDDDDIAREVERDLERIGQAALDARLDDEPIDNDVDGMVPALVEANLLFERSVLSVDAGLREALRLVAGQLLPEFSLAPADHRRQHVDARVLRVQHHHVHDPLERLRRDLPPALRAVGNTDVCEQQPEVVVDLGDGADRGPRVRCSRLLLDRDRGRQPVDQVDVRLLHLIEKLPRVRRQRFDVPTLSLRVDRVEGERRLARARQARDDDELVPGDVDVDVLEVVNARAANGNPPVCHVS